MTVTRETGRPELKDGAEWADSEDCIIGNEQGLRNLAKACNVALEKGEYLGADLGDYVGVKLRGNDWFKNPTDSAATRVGNKVLAVGVVAIGACALIGFVAVVRWMFRMVS